MNYTHFLLAALPAFLNRDQNDEVMSDWRQKLMIFGARV